MNKTLRIIFHCALALVICYFVFFIYLFISSHSVNWETPKQYLWIFKDTAKRKIDTRLCYSLVKKRDIYNHFVYNCTINDFQIKCDYGIIVWEFKDLNKAELKDLYFNQNVNLDFIKFRAGETLNKKSDLEITVKFRSAFNNIMDINLDEYSKIERKFEGKNYKGFYGSINKMSLSNEKGEHQIILNYTEGLTPTVLLLYKGHQSFFLIMINSKNSFDESVINILNLS